MHEKKLWIFERAHNENKLFWKEEWYHWQTKNMNHNLIKQTVTFANKKSKDKFNNDEKHQRVRHYYLSTGKYRGVLHSICNKYN